MKESKKESEMWFNLFLQHVVLEIIRSDMVKKVKVGFSI